MLPNASSTAKVQSRHLNLLCESAKVLLRPGDETSFRALLEQQSSSPDAWPAFEQTADHQAMTSLFVGALRRAGSSPMPPEIADRLYKRARLNACRNLMYVAEWRRLLSAFHAAGISVISVKGPSFALRSYASLALRDFTDLDLLVRRKDVIIARDVLAAEGYQLYSATAGSSDAALLSSGNCQLGFTKRDRNTWVDLHWSLLHKMFSFQLPTEELFESARAEQVEGVSFLSLSPEHLLLYLCAHGAKHCWIRLRWLCDIAFYISSTQNIDWNLCFYLAEAKKCDLVLKHSLLLAEQILGLDLPPLAKNYCNSGKARKLANSARAFIFREKSGVGRAEELRYYLAFASSFCDYARLLFRRFFVPTETEWKHTRLPGMLHCFYFAIRPARYLWGHLPRAAVQSRGLQSRDRMAD